jgi:hypothetical protein
VLESNPFIFSSMLGAISIANWFTNVPERYQRSCVEGHYPPNELRDGLCEVVPFDREVARLILDSPQPGQKVLISDALRTKALMRSRYGIVAQYPRNRGIADYESRLNLKPSSLVRLLEKYRSSMRLGPLKICDFGCGESPVLPEMNCIGVGLPFEGANEDPSNRVIWANILHLAMRSRSRFDALITLVGCVRYHPLNRRDYFPTPEGGHDEEDQVIDITFSLLQAIHWLKLNGLLLMDFELDGTCNIERSIAWSFGRLLERGILKEADNLLEFVRSPGPMAARPLLVGRHPTFEDIKALLTLDDEGMYSQTWDCSLAES